ncbi:MAG: FAD binding domain-containing protein [Caldisericota bacterium]|nr:FAD binding domain-containing protein [Caldisericota bacterium]
MLKLKNVKSCFTPNSIQEAVDILKKSDGKAVIVGGGLDITVFPNPTIEQLIFLNKLGLTYIREDDENIKIGATSTITDVAKAPVMQNYLKGKVKIALTELASELLRNQITMGGSIARHHFYSDILPALYALRAKIMVSGGEFVEEFFIDDFYRNDLKVLMESCIVVGVHLNKYDDSFQFGSKRFVRNATDIALLNMAILAQIEEDIIKDISISVGSRPGPAYRFEQGEAFLRGKKLTKVLAEDFGLFTKSNVDVAKDMHLSREYRQHIAGIYTKEILLDFIGGVG